MSRWRFGMDLDGKEDATPGFDESCMLNASLVPESEITLPRGWKYPQRVQAIGNLVSTA